MLRLLSSYRSVSAASRCLVQAARLHEHSLRALDELALGELEVGLREPSPQILEILEARQRHVAPRALRRKRH